MAHYSCVKWGHNLCVCFAPPILMSTRFVPAVQNHGLKANVRIHKVEWTALFGLMHTTYTTYITLYSCWPLILLRPLVDAIANFCVKPVIFSLGFFRIFVVIHVLKWANRSIKPYFFSLDEPNGGHRSSVSISL